MVFAVVDVILHKRLQAHDTRLAMPLAACLFLALTALALTQEPARPTFNDWVAVPSGAPRRLCSTEFIVSILESHQQPPDHRDP